MNILRIILDFRFILSFAPNFANLIYYIVSILIFDRLLFIPDHFVQLLTQKYSIKKMIISNLESTSYILVVHLYMLQLIKWVTL
jgi:hypothetical protein